MNTTLNKYNKTDYKYSTDYTACKPLRLLEMIQDISGYNLNIEFNNENPYKRWVIKSNYKHNLNDRSLYIECNSYSDCTEHYSISIIDHKTSIKSQRVVEVSHLRNIISILDMILNITILFLTF